MTELPEEPAGAAFRPLSRPADDAAAQDGIGPLPLSAKRLALVTGGHRRLGAAISVALAAQGYALALHGSHDVRLESALALALEDHATEWEGFVADFADPEAAEELIAAIALHFGRPPDLLVNSAAIFGQDRLDSVTADDLMRHYAVNCAAPVLLSKAFATVPAGLTDRCIINILDQRIDHPHGDQLAYTLSKMALAGFTQLAARDLAPRIRVNAVAPGLTIATEDYSAAQMDRLRDAMPLHRLPEAQQIAQAVVYLAEATAVTGQVLYIDGGAHIQSYPRDFMHL
ncbi:SDR family oxidoreductase [Sphingobium algorifonticola]|uniref:SDR family oxidoreductase n=1 Tax=Sphingobium algorifonticola TaxID=2008318 RepID=A0A437JBJ6_9SPHN|nr:SDR family oxidoreductase [Sphingobium algorifonticola]RVT43296.1 SDR family oxidoreductase [Sphingobium algorifonticola]